MQVKKLKILHVNNYAGGSGADLVYRTTVDALDEYAECINMTACIAAGGDEDLSFLHWQSRQGLGKLRYIYSPENRVRLSAYLARHQPDILHVHGFYSAISPSILLAIRKAKLSWGMKFVQTAHSHELICANASAYDYTSKRICTDCKGDKFKLKIFYRNCDRRGWFYSWVKGIRCLLAQRLLNQVALTDRIICPSELMFQNLLDEGLDESKLSLVRNPLRLQIPHPGAVSKLRRKEFVYFGRFSPEKNLLGLLNAFLTFQKTHDDWRLVLIGDGEDRQKIIDRVIEAKASGAVELLPFMSQSQLYQRIVQSRVMLMASKVLENAPLVIPEAVMCGLFPVVPDCGGMKESVEWLGLGQCYQVNNQSSLHAALVAAASKEYSETSLNPAQAKIKQALSPRTYVEQITNIYHSLVPA